MHTEADETLDKARELLSNAYNKLLTFLSDGCWGRDEYSDEKIEQIQEAALEILKLKRKI